MNKDEEFHEISHLSTTAWGIYSHRIKDYAVQCSCQPFQHAITREMTPASQNRPERERSGVVCTFVSSFLHTYSHSHSPSQTIISSQIFLQNSTLTILHSEFSFPDYIAFRVLISRFSKLGERKTSLW